MPPLRERLGSLLAVPRDRDARIFAVTGIIDALGNSMFLPVSALFFVNVAGLPVTRVGIGLSIAGVVGMLGPLLSGPPVDRFGARRVVLVLYALRAVAYSCYPLVRGFWPFVALVSATAVVDHMSRPTLQALAAGLADEADRVTTLAFVRSVRNLGWALGGLVVAGALAIGGKGAYVGLVLGDAATFLVAGVLMLRVRDVRVPVPEGPRTGYGTVLRNRRFVALGALHGILTLNVAMLILGFPLWIDQRTSAPTAIAGVVFTLNSLLVVVLQVPFSKRLTSVALGGRALRWSGYATALAAVMLALVPGLPVWPAIGLLVAAAVVQCAGELWEAAGGWAVSLGMAPEHARGRYLGLWDMGFVFYDVGGPVLMAFVVEDAGRGGWLVFGAFMAVVGIVASRLAAGVEIPRASAWHDLNEAPEIRCGGAVVRFALPDVVTVEHGGRTRAEALDGLGDSNLFAAHCVGGRLFVVGETSPLVWVVDVDALTVTQTARLDRLDLEGRYDPGGMHRVTFRTLDGDEVLVEHELGVAQLGPDGRLLWERVHDDV